MRTIILVAIVPMAMAGRADAGVEMRLEMVATGEIGAYAEAMSVGPAGPAFSDTLAAGIVRIVRDAYFRLRATLSSCERSTWLNVDVIKTSGGSDTRVVTASYKLSAYDIRKLPTEGLPAGGAHLDPPLCDAIEWLDANTFIWHMREDCVLLERLEENRFKVSRFNRAR